MRLWLRQFGGEWRKVCAQRRAWIGFGACLFVELLFAALFQLRPVRALAQGDYHRAQLDMAGAFSGLTMAAHLLGETSMLVGSLFIALIAAGAISGELEDGTLRTTLSRPVLRSRVWLQRLLLVAGYTVALSGFIAVTSLLVGLLFEGPGRLVMLLAPEGVFGEFEFAAGLGRYALASALLAVSLFTIALLAFAISSLRCKPATATALALGVFLADAALRRTPALAPAKPYFLMTRLISWLHAFDDTIPWGLLWRNYAGLLVLDALLVVASLAAFRRLELRP